MPNLIRALIASLFVLAGPAHAETVGIPTDQVEGSFEFQKTPVWCWAATIQMALNYYGFDVTQEQIVKNTFGTVRPSTANWMQMTNNMNFVGTSQGGDTMMVSASVFVGSPSAEVIINHLKNEKPVIMAFRNQRTFAGHAVLITGVDYDVVNGRARISELIIRDPFPYSEQHVENDGRVVTSNTITPTHIWLVNATPE